MIGKGREREEKNSLTFELHSYTEHARDSFINDVQHFFGGL